MSEEEQPASPKQTKATMVKVGDIETGKDGKLGPIDNDYGRYLNFEELGEGGTATVLRCQDPHLGRSVALKQLHPHYMDDRILVKRFTREARVMAQLQHPNILPVHELGQDNEGNLYFTMKEVKGDTLHDVLKGVDLEKPAYLREYPFERLIDIFIQICQAIAFAHRHGVVHRDLKPANVLIGKFGEVLVLDWGLAKLVDGEEEEISDADFVGMTQSELTTAGSISGTPMYMSPEQAKGEVSAIDTPSDIYSLGSILYQILTGDYCVGGTKVMEIIRNVVKEEVVPPRKKAPKNGIPPELEAICMKALEKNPSDRYDGMKEMLTDLKNYRAGLPISVMNDAPLRKFGKWYRRHPVIGSLAQGVVATIIVAAIMYGVMSGSGDRALMSLAEQELGRGELIYKQLEKKEIDRGHAAAERILPGESGEEKSLKADVSSLRLKMDRHYHSAASLLNQLDHGPEVMAGLRQILNHRIAFSLAKGEKENVEAGLEDARDWFGENYEQIANDPKFQGWLEQAESALKDL